MHVIATKQCDIFVSKETLKYVWQSRQVYKYD